MKLGVVILNWNGMEVTPKCLDSLYKGTQAPDEIVVVDNASTDHSGEFIRTSFPDAAYIQNNENLGFSGGCNVGIRHLLDRDFDLILLLNNDALVDPNCIGVLLDTARKYPAAAYGATIYEVANPNAVWYGGGKLNTKTLEATHLLAPDSHGPEPTDFITGCCLMMNAATVRRIGLLDEGFFAYYEDLDWCLRARQAGERLIYVPDAVVHHDVSHSFRHVGNRQKNKTSRSWAQKRPLVMYLSYRNRLLLARKHACNGLHLGFLAGRIGLRGVLHTLLLTLVGEMDRAKAVLRGLSAGLFTPGAPADIERYLR